MVGANFYAFCNYVQNRTACSFFSPLEIFMFARSLFFLFPYSRLLLSQCCQPPTCSPDICAKSESNPKCLHKSLHQTNPKRCLIAKPVLQQKRIFSTKPFSRQKRVFVKLQLGHVIIGMIPATPSMHEKHACDHKKIVNIV